MINGFFWFFTFFLLPLVTPLVNQAQQQNMGSLGLFMNTTGCFVMPSWPPLFSTCCRDGIVRVLVADMHD